MIAKYKDIQEELDSLRRDGKPRGNDTGFMNFDEYYSIKYGSFTIILAAPHSGKSELGYEIIANQVSKFGKKCLIYSPETGSVADIYAELIHKHFGLSIFKSHKVHLEDKKYYGALAYIDDRYSIINSDDKSFSYKEILDMVTDEDIIFVDPNNEVRHVMEPDHLGRQDIYIEDISAYIRRYCKKNNKHAILTMHPATQTVVFDNESKINYYPMPNARQAAGGQAWFRKAMGWINLWRPPAALKDPSTGKPFESNIVLVNIEKAKPKGIGKRGTLKLYYDWFKNRYYEDIGGFKRFAFDHEKTEQKQNSIDFLEEPISEPSPF